MNDIEDDIVLMRKNELDAEPALSDVEGVPLRRALIFMAFINVGKYLDIYR